jgi:hypothetical protein
MTGPFHPLRGSIPMPLAGGRSLPCQRSRAPLRVNREPCLVEHDLLKSFGHLARRKKVMVRSCPPSLTART